MNNFSILFHFTCWDQFEMNDDPVERVTTAEAIRTLVDSYQKSQYCYSAKEKIEEMSKIVSLIIFNWYWFIFLINNTNSFDLLVILLRVQKGTVLDSGGSQASFLMQAFTLTIRSFVNMSRDFGYYWLRLVIYLVVTVCIGTIYLNVGTSYSAILVIILSLLFGDNKNVCGYISSMKLIIHFVQLIHAGKRCMRLFRVWLCDFYVDWWIPFIRGRYEGIYDNS